MARQDRDPVTITVVTVTITTGVLFPCTILCGLSVGVWRDRSGTLHKGVPYSQMRIVARAKWQLYHLKGFLERGGLKPHVVLAGDNSDMADAAEEEHLANAPPSHDKASACPVICRYLSIHPIVFSSIHPSLALNAFNHPQSIHQMQSEKCRPLVLNFM